MISPDLLKAGQRVRIQIAGNTHHTFATVTDQQRKQAVGKPGCVRVWPVLLLDDGTRLHEDYVVHAIAMVITVTDRGTDYHACLDGEPACWAAGKTPYEAIGDLVVHHPERFGVDVSPLRELDA